MAADVSGIGYFAPIAGFLLVVLIVYAILSKTKLLGENKFLNIAVAFTTASIFIAAASAREYIQTVTPFFVILLVCLFFFLMIIGFVGEPLKNFNKGVGVVFLVALGIICLIAAFFVFSYLIVGYLPGPGYGTNADPKILYFLDWLYSSRVAGTILVILISLGVAWVLVKSK